MRTRSKSITLAENKFEAGDGELHSKDSVILELPKNRTSLLNASTSGTIKRSHSINTASTTTPKRKSIFSSLFGSSTNKTTSASAKKKLVVDTKHTSPAAPNGPNSANHNEDLRSLYSVSSSENSIIHSALERQDLKDIPVPATPSKPVPEVPLTYEEKLKHVSTKRVAFKVQTFTIDPPQQIPGRNPRKGLKLLPYELSTSINIDEGIASGTNDKPAVPSKQTDPTQTKEYRVLLDQHTAHLKESMAHQQSSYFRAKKLEHELEKTEAQPNSSYNPIKDLLGTPSKNSASPKSPVSALAESIQKVLPVPQQNAILLAKQSQLDNLTDPLAKRPGGLIREASEENIIIDMPIHRHHSFVDELPTQLHLSTTVGNDESEDLNTDSSSSSSSLTTVDKNVSLDKIYTRCCHLREILPIPITLKQLKNRKNPLQVLKFLNPKPTLVDILSFTDFIQCIDLRTLVFDNVLLTDRMVEIIFKSVAKLMLKNQLEKLSLRNVTINKENWTLLCKIISMAGNTFTTLDVSQTKLRKDLQDVKGYLRSEMNWDMFWYVIKKREETLSKASKPECPYEKFNLIYFNSVTPGAKYSLPPPPPEEKEKEKEKMRELKRLLKEQQQITKEKDAVSADTKDE